MPGIFISYRRIDTVAWAGHLFADLRKSFGASQEALCSQGAVIASWRSPSVGRPLPAPDGPIASEDQPGSPCYEILEEGSLVLRRDHQGTLGVEDLQAIQGERRTGEGIPGRADQADVAQRDRPPERAAANEQIRPRDDVEGPHENPEDEGVHRGKEREESKPRTGLRWGHHEGSRERGQPGNREDGQQPGVAL